MRFSISCALFFVIVALVVSPGYSSSGIVKICVVSDPKHNDTELQMTIDSIALFIAKNHTKAPQIYEHTSGDVCDFIGSVDRAKMIADFILVVKRNYSEPINCDVEWGRESFAIMNFFDNGTLIKNRRPHPQNKFYAEIAFTSQETPKEGEDVKWVEITRGAMLLNLLWPRFLSSASRIPEDYAFKAEREERMKRRTLKAIIALMSLVVCSLLVIMFLGSLARYNESKAQKAAEEARKKKKLEQQNAQPAKKSEVTSDKSEKSKETTKKSEGDKSEKSSKSEHSETKKLLGDKSSKSKKE